MGKYFPKLTQNTVWIEVQNGGFHCPMLPVSALPELDDISQTLSNTHTPEEIRKVKARMVALAATVIPKEYAYGLERFDCLALGELLAYLMYGDADDQGPQSGPESGPESGPKTKKK